MSAPSRAGGLSCHVLDTSQGRPATGVRIALERFEEPSGWSPVAVSTTDSDGRVRDLLGGQPLEPGEYRARFETGDYFERRGVQSFYPRVEVTFAVASADEHYHVPLLLSPHGYTTYRGS